MRFLTISDKFHASQLVFMIDQPYMFTCSKLPKQFEKFKVDQVKIPWSSEYILVKDDSDLQEIFNSFIQRNVGCIRVDHGDDTAGSDSHTDVAANVEGREKNEDNDNDESK
ncbi:hypothetical protein ACOSQ4_016093 [Xanthoceras sorbifolium]